MSDFASPPSWDQPHPQQRRGDLPPPGPTPRRRSRLPAVAWLGIVAAVVLVAGLSYAVWLEVSIANAQPAQPGDTGSISTMRVVPGMCVEQALGPDGTVDDVTVVPCSEPHLGEVVAAREFELDEWPGSSHVSSRAIDYCAGSLTPGGGLVNESAESLGLTWVVWVPTAATWSHGDRSAVCVVFADQPWTGSLYAGTADLTATGS